MTIAIRPYAAADWDAICRIHDAARVEELRATVGLEAFLELAATYEAEGLFDGDVWVAELDGAVAGFLAGTRHEITWVYVDPALQRRGVGRALMGHVLERASGPVRLEVLDGNPARAFYERLGFVVESTTTGRLAGNEAFRATGHTMVWARPAGRDAARGPRRRPRAETPPAGRDAARGPRRRSRRAIDHGMVIARSGEASRSPHATGQPRRGSGQSTGDVGVSGREDVVRRSS